MGIIEVNTGNKKYVLEFEVHNELERPELPVENLHAVYLESAFTMSGSRGKGALEKTLNDCARIPPSVRLKSLDIIRRAQSAGAELWVYSVPQTSREDKIENLSEILTFPVSYPSALRLASRGHAEKRVISRAIMSGLSKIERSTRLRSKAMSNAITRLAEDTGHSRIGLLLGAGHADMVGLLKKGVTLSERERKKLADRKALTAFRCVYDKANAKWRAEEHRL